MTDTEPDMILLSAGGTGGHVTPAAALAQDLLSRGYRVALITDDRGRKYASLFSATVDLHVIQAGTLGAGLTGKFKGLVRLGTGIVQAARLLTKLRPSVVVGFGGYPSFPAVYVAQRCKIPTVIHQSDAVLGRANAMLAPKADRIALSFSHVEGLDETDAVRAVLTGNPVREEIAALYTKPYQPPGQDGVLRLFIMGGSLGAHILSDVVPEALSRLPDPYRKRLEITQQCRAEDIERVRTLYGAAEITARLASFFDDISAILSQTHLVIARSGASTVAELTTAGRPAIFIPLNLHTDNQQKINAETVADAGGAWVMTEDGFTAEALLARIETFLQNPETLFRAAEAARGCGRPDAARRLGNLVTAIASGWDKDARRGFDLTQGRAG